MLASPALVPTYAESDGDDFIPDDLVGRSYDAGENAVDAITATLSMRQRANLAVYCYRKQLLGTAVGDTLYAQSRERPISAERKSYRPKVTLATFARLAPTRDAFNQDEPFTGEATDPDAVV